MLNLPMDEKYPPLVLSPEQHRKRLMTTLARWLFGSPQSVVMAVEDLHWFDASSLERVNGLDSIDGELQPIPTVSNR